MFRATKSKIVHGVTPFEAAPEAVAHERRKVASIPRVLRPGSAKEFAIRPGIASDHRRVKISYPLPDQPVHILHPKVVGPHLPDRRQEGRRRSRVPSAHLCNKLLIIFAVGPLRT